VLGESATDGAGGLWSEVERSVLLALVEEAELSALVGVDDGQDLGDGLANIVAVTSQSVLCSIFPCFPSFSISPVPDFSTPYGSIEDYTHILVSLAAEPPAIFWVRS
jgi:hypothetical protein